MIQIRLHDQLMAASHKLAEILYSQKGSAEKDGKEASSDKGPEKEGPKDEPIDTDAEQK